ncbi:uncharacterized protein K460DRAFT_278788 [Cucurbitaria berberidis CBS 394.84]|uniref:Uncharacterized protein n=1 Tax=Cucurbitaria berberidis CBS 394.84 TaxID=1168544 RepID=A0A9P4GJA9_9PLEO|nr:uncharacterized protein K460DRAFT_278788 [Cucurbitaria berberidis CBS 394.84]KAF1847273.1 hypothetical protein K460DRAFT_278788 [Cucurbitaria berberidis CBS 394.84]
MTQIDWRSGYQSLEDWDRASADTPYAAAVFSIGSQASSKTGISSASGFSAAQITTATEELLFLFHHDEKLVLLYENAMEKPEIGPERLQRNMCRILKVYARNLSREATTELERMAAQLVSLKARYLAQSIIEKFQLKPVPHQVLHYENQDESSEDDNANQVDEDLLEDLQKFRNFLIESAAFASLHAQLQSFVVSTPARRELLGVSGSVDISSPDTSTGHDIKRATINKTTFVGNVQELLNPSKYLLRAVLVATGYLEPPLRAGFIRLRWECSCGDRFFGDVMQYEEGGIARLKEHMQLSTGAKFSEASGNQHGSGQRYIFRYPGWAQKTINVLSSNFTRSNTPSSCLPQHNGSNTASASRSGSGHSSQQGTLHLAVCMQRSQDCRIVHQDRIETITTDRELFRYMKTQLARRRSHIRTLLSLRCVQGLFFVKFRLRVCGRVEVRDHDPCCTLSPLKTCECIPPAPKVEPAPDAEYRCKPAGPLATWPPVLSQELMHMLASPDCIHEKETWILDQLPKRTCGELQGKVGQPAEGWGIHYREGWDSDSITGTRFVIFLLASLLFAVLWSAFKMDVQGAFGVSAYMTAATGILISWVVRRASKFE